MVTNDPEKNAAHQAAWRARRRAELESLRKGQTELDVLRRRLAEVEARLRTELNNRPSADEVRRLDAVALHVQRLTTDVDTYQLLRRCLHPDSRRSVSDETLHKAWLAFQNFELITYDKKTCGAPLPQTLDDWLRKRDEVTRRRRKRI